MDLLRQILYVICKNLQETEWNMIISQNGDRSKTIGFEFIFTNIIYQLDKEAKVLHGIEITFIKSQANFQCIDYLGINGQP